MNSADQTSETVKTAVSEDIPAWLKTMEASANETERMMWIAFQELKEYQKKTFDEIKESRKESDKRLEESRKEADKRLEESRKETDKRLEESKQELTESLRETNKIVSDVTKNLGGIGNKLGQLTEALFSGELWKKFEKHGYEFNSQAQDKKFIMNGKVIAEADFFLENGIYVMPVEVKTKPNTEDVDNHIKRIETIRAYMDSRGDSRKLLGAVAGGVFTDHVLEYAQAQGLYAFVQTGDSVAIADTPPGFEAREW